MHQWGILRHTAGHTMTVALIMTAIYFLSAFRVKLWAHCLASVKELATLSSLLMAGISIGETGVSTGRRFHSLLFHITSIVV